MIAKRGLKRVLVVVLTFVVVLSSGCEKPPAQEIIRAEKTRDEASQKGADFYVPDVFAKAEESLTRAKDLVASKRYKEAKKAAEEAERNAREAIALLERNRAKMHTEVEQMLHDALRRIDDFKMLVAKAIEKKAPVNEQDIQSAVDRWDTSVAAVKNDLEQGKIREARNRLRTLLDEVMAQQEGLAVAAKPKLRKK